MRRYGIEKPYEKLKELTRGHKLTQKDFQDFIAKLEIPDEVRQELMKLTPMSYIGNAIEQTKQLWYSTVTGWIIYTTVKTAQSR